MEDNDKKIQELFKELDDFLDSCKRPVFSVENIIVPREQIDIIIDKLKEYIPTEVEGSKKVLRNRDKILDNARKEAENIINEANEQAENILNEIEIVKKAKKEAKEIVDSAMRTARQKIDDAIDESNEYRMSAVNYTIDTLSSIEEFMIRLKEEQEGRVQRLLDAGEFLVDGLKEGIETIAANKRVIEDSLNEDMEDSELEE